MRLVTFTLSADEEPRLGALLEGNTVLDFAADGAGIQRPRSFLECFDLAGRVLPEARSLHARAVASAEALDELRAAGCVRAVTEVSLLAPVPRPGKVLCIGLNYRDHAAESGMPIPERPLLFSKFPTSVVGPGATVRIPPGSVETDYEAELAIVIGRSATRVSTEQAQDHVLGYANLNDVSARDFQFADGQWQRGKSCDTFAPLGPFVATTDEVPDPHALTIRFRLNGETLQDSNTDQLVFGVPELVSALSESITLEPGDVIATGTPPGVGFARKPPVYLKPGDEMEVEVEGLGVLANPVAAWDD